MFAYFYYFIVYCLQIIPWILSCVINGLKYKPYLNKHIWAKIIHRVHQLFSQWVLNELVIASNLSQSFNSSYFALAKKILAKKCVINFIQSNYVWIWCPSHHIIKHNKLFLFSFRHYFDVISAHKNAISHWRHKIWLGMW